MASLNKTSLREGLDTLQGQLERLCADGKMGQAGCALFQALLMLFDLLLAVCMEKRTPKNSRNPGLPSSQTNNANACLRPRTSTCASAIASS